MITYIPKVPDNSKALLDSVQSSILQQREMEMRSKATKNQRTWKLKMLKVRTLSTYMYGVEKLICLPFANCTESGKHWGKKAICCTTNNTSDNANGWPNDQ